MPEPTQVLPEVLSQIQALPVSSRPLIVCDVDEVILHLIAHLENYLHARELAFLKYEYRLTGNIGRRDNRQPLSSDDVRSFCSSSSTRSAILRTWCPARATLSMHWRTTGT